MDYKKLFDLTGKVAIVTGGAGYLGAENVKALKDFGATVVIAGIPMTARWEGEEKPVCDLEVDCDISSTESIANCFKTVYEKFGRIDVLVNCATFGAGYGEASQLEFMDDETWEKGIDGALNSVFRCTREVVKYMKETGGSIINYCSMYGVVSPDLRIYGDNPQKQPPNYGAGKAGVAQLTRYSAGALAQYGIRVNCVTPGPFPNPANQNDMEFNAKLAGKTMLERFGQSYEMSGAVLLLASDASSFMTGSNITVDGGWTAW
ncbi:MAG: SDR family oxidoreductase [Clostridia bacterium]|nr:SDR family oxidoreductase [Clostridia bacterium]MBQ6895013.1 SDR family oxidoreductase [Clostridia bacterium]